MNEKEYGARISKITADYDERLSSAKETNFNLSRSLELSRKELEMCNSEIAKLNATIEAQKSTLSIFEGAKLSLDRIISVRFHIYSHFRSTRERKKIPSPRFLSLVKKLPH